MVEQPAEAKSAAPFGYVHDRLNLVLCLLVKRLTKKDTLDSRLRSFREQSESQQHQFDSTARVRSNMGLNGAGDG
eukprot:3917065-Amphidinium_carterae.1